MENPDPSISDKCLGNRVRVCYVTQETPLAVILQWVKRATKLPWIWRRGNLTGWLRHYARIIYVFHALLCLIVERDSTHVYH